jgi:hypothetical protein
MSISDGIIAQYYPGFALLTHSQRECKYLSQEKEEWK